MLTPEDPLGYGVDLPLENTFHPMGYPVEIRTNSPFVLDAAERLWKSYPRISNAQPMHMRFIVSPNDGMRIPSPPRAQEHLFIIVHGPGDFAVADLRAGFATAFLTEWSVKDRSYFRYYFLEPLTYILQAAAHFVFVHASCIANHGQAIVLCGPSGAGKTCLAYACAKRGWSFVSGDAVHILRDTEDRKIVGRPFEIRFRASAQDLFPELSQFQPVMRVNGKTDVEIETAKLGIPIAVEAVAHHIVFTRPSDSTQVNSGNRNEAIRALKDTVCFGDASTRADQYRALARFVELPIWELEYQNFDEADEVLRALLESKR